MLGQAEHDPNSGGYLICLSDAFAQKTLAEVEKQLAVLPTREIAALSWRDNGIVHVAESPEEAVALSDDYAPEHLELHVEDTDYYFRHLTNYGSLFIGEETTVAYGDKSIGTNHILPTSRAARYTGGVWVGKFLKTCTYQRMTSAASVEVGKVTERQCNVERMLAHAITAKVRGAGTLRAGESVIHKSPRGPTAVDEQVLACDITTGSEARKTKAPFSSCDCPMRFMGECFFSRRTNSGDAADEGNGPGLSN